MGEGHRKYNVAEGWNNRLRNLVGHYHPGVWSLIEALQADTAEASTTILKHAVGIWSDLRAREQPNSISSVSVVCVMTTPQETEVCQTYCGQLATAFASCVSR